MKDTFCIYKIENTINGKFYIGMSRDIKTRWRQHCYRSSSKLGIAIQEYGRDAFELTILKKYAFYAAARKAEKKIVKKLKPAYNNYYAREKIKTVQVGAAIDEKLYKKIKKQIGRRSISSWLKELIWGEMSED